jgi:selenocysteine-specific elongation factor
MQAPHLHAPTRRVDARLTLLGSEARPLRQWAPVHVHHGAADVTGRVVLLAGDVLAPGQTALVQLALDSDMALAAGDRFVLRDAGASRTIGGGVLLDLRPPERGRRAAQRLADLEALAAPQAEAAALALLGQPGRALDLGTLLRDRARPPEAAARLVAAHGLVALGDGFGSVMAAESWGGYAAALGATLDAHHAAHPDLPGLGAERLRLSLAPRLPMPAFAAALDRLRREGALVVDRAWVRRPGHEVRFSAEEEAVWSLLRARLGGAGRFRPPRVRDMARAMGQDEAMLRRLCRMAARRGDAEEVAQDHFFLAGTVAEMACTARALAEAAQDGRFNAVAFRDRLDNGRKVAIHILEFFDRHGLTMRRGDWRRINPHKANLFTQPASTEAAE